jgi:hypothetical protein
MTTSEKGTGVPLCPMHRTEMKLCEVSYPDLLGYERNTINRFRCTVVGCDCTCPPSRSYSRFGESESIERDESPRDLCPEHRRPLCLLEYDSQSRIEVWGCPKACCEPIKKSRME